MLNAYHTTKVDNDLTRYDLPKPNGEVIDADCILADIVNGADMHENGIGREVLQLWKQTSDKETFEALFLTVTGTAFSDYVSDCLTKTTAPA